MVDQRASRCHSTSDEMSASIGSVETHSSFLELGDYYIVSRTAHFPHASDGKPLSTLNLQKQVSGGSFLGAYIRSECAHFVAHLLLHFRRIQETVMSPQRGVSMPQAFELKFPPNSVLYMKSYPLLTSCSSIATISIQCRHFHAA